MQFRPPEPLPMENARQLAPSLLAAPEQSQNPQGATDGMSAQAAQSKAEAMAAQGSPMLSQVQQMGGRYQRRYNGLLG